MAGRDEMRPTVRSEVIGALQGYKKGAQTQGLSPATCLPVAQG
mgnify:CR=1 FL=1|jgi:hypothetical protein